MANEAPATENVYEALGARLRRIQVLGSVSGLLGWDEQVNLPEGAAGQRAAQAELLAELHHASATDAGLAPRSLPASGCWRQANSMRMRAWW